MLKTRVITALILTAALLAAIFGLPPYAWAAVTAGVAVLAGWEFARLAGLGSAGSVLYGAGVLAGCVGLGFLLPQSVVISWPDAERARLFGIFGIAAAFWLTVVPLWLRGRWSMRSKLLSVPVGAILLLPTWLAMVQIRTLDPWLLVACIALVSFADIAAYFSGRRFGKRKLAPLISPGKTWEGACGAVAVVTVYGLAVALATGWAASPARIGFLVLFLPLLTFISIAGDLFESLLKRQSGFKDSSNLLPGHGGVLDRIDSLTSALPLLAMLLAFA